MPVFARACVRVFVHGSWSGRSHRRMADTVGGNSRWFVKCWALCIVPFSYYRQSNTVHSRTLNSSHGCRANYTKTTVDALNLYTHNLGQIGTAIHSLAIWCCWTGHQYRSTPLDLFYSEAIGWVTIEWWLFHLIFLKNSVKRRVHWNTLNEDDFLPAFWIRYLRGRFSFTIN